MARKVRIFIVFLQNKDLTTCKNLSFNQEKKFLVLPFFPEKRLNRDTKLIADFETAILHYIDGTGRNYVSVLGSVANTEYITSRQCSAELPSKNCK